MKIKFEGEYKSLKTFESEELSDFTVITGKNGSGKTQLIEIFENHRKGNPNFELTLAPNINDFQIEGIEADKFSLIDNDVLKGKIRTQYNTYSQFGDNYQLLVSILVKNDISLNEIKEADSIAELLKPYTDLNLSSLLRKANREKDRNFRSNNEQQIDSRAKNFLISDRRLIELLKYLCETRVKELEEIDENDFFGIPLPSKYLDNEKLFRSELGTIFYAYAKRRFQHDILKMRKRDYGENNHVNLNKDFEKENKPPWEQINEILQDHGMNFYFTGVSRTEFTPDANIAFELIKEGINKKINFRDLSSGEKVIIGLIIKLFTGEFYKDNLQFPELIILDEPDAHLHPEMSNLLIRVLNNTFVKKYGIKVIMTTHSPSTVALTPENSIYELKNEPETELKKINKDNALSLLTEFIPTLSIDYKNHKQVFVEGEVDRKYYQMIAREIQREKLLKSKLYFISHSSGKNSCDQVIDIVKQLRNAGNKKCHGIIDWDKKNKNQENIYVHGFKKRYSLENYLLDPICLVALFLEKDGAHKVRKDLGFDEFYNPYRLESEDNEKLQEIAGWVVKKFCDEFENFEVKEMLHLEYFNGKKIKVPSWYILEQGHTMEDRFCEVFPVLAALRKEKKLKKKLIQTAGRCFPLVPKESVELLQKISA